MQQDWDMSLLPLSPIHIHAQPEEQNLDSKTEGGEVQVNNRRKAWNNFRVRTSKMGIFREAMIP